MTSSHEYHQYALENGGMDDYPDTRFPTRVECLTCDGTGEIPGPDPDNEDMTCPTCGGSGFVPDDYDGDDW